TRLPAGVAVRGRALRPQVRLPLLQPAASASPRTTSTLDPGVRARARAAASSPASAALGGSDSRAGWPGPTGHGPGPTARGASARVPAAGPWRGGDRGAQAPDADCQGPAGAWP